MAEGDAFRWRNNMIIHKSEYGDSPNNFHVMKEGNELRVQLTYPPYTDTENEHGKCRHVYIDQESVRASDGVRLHYDFERDGFVAEQPKPRMVALGKNSYDTVNDWIEVGFFPSWRFNDWENGNPSQSEFDRADAERVTNVTFPDDKEVDDDEKGKNTEG